MKRPLFYLGLGLLPALTPPLLAKAAGNPAWRRLGYAGLLLAAVVLITFGLLEWRKGRVTLDGGTLLRAVAGLLLGGVLALAVGVGAMYVVGAALGFGSAGVGIAVVPVLALILLLPAVGYVSYRMARGSDRARA